MESFFYALLGVFLLCGGGVLFVQARKDLQMALESDSWPLHPATITHTAIEQTSEGDSVFFDPRITFAYEIAGRRYFGNTIAIAAWRSSSKRRAISVVQRYPVGRKVQVAVNPSDDAYAVLEPNVRSHAYAFVSASVLALAAGAFLLYLQSLVWRGLL